MKISEFQLIERFERSLPKPSPEVIRGIFDDCAVIDLKNGLYQLLTTDCLVEGVHFELHYFTFFELGKKALAVNLSDIAAMGGKPSHALVTLALPRSFKEEEVMDFYAGLEQIAQEFSVSIVGGDLSSSPKHFFINIALTGEVPKQNCKYRQGAQKGDAVYVTGPLGSSALGLYLLKKKKQQKETNFLKAHKTPRPQVAAGQFLGKEQGVTSMIDLSDGLIGDLNHILHQSKVGAELIFDDIPREQDLEIVAATYKLSALQLILSGGEDYQLLFTVKPDQELELINRSHASGFHFSKIGVITDEKEGLKVLDRNEKELEGEWNSFDHFR